MQFYNKRFDWTECVLEQDIHRLGSGESILQDNHTKNKSSASIIPINLCFETFTILQEVYKGRQSGNVKQTCDVINQKYLFAIMMMIDMSVSCQSWLSYSCLKIEISFLK